MCPKSFVGVSTGVPLHITALYIQSSLLIEDTVAEGDMYHMMEFYHQKMNNGCKNF
jgi:hypothetical protein